MRDGAVGRKPSQIALYFANEQLERIDVELADFRGRYPVAFELAVARVGGFADYFRQGQTEKVYERAVGVRVDQVGQEPQLGEVFRTVPVIGFCDMVVTVFALQSGIVRFEPLGQELQELFQPVCVVSCGFHLGDQTGQRVDVGSDRVDPLDGGLHQRRARAHVGIEQQPEMSFRAVLVEQLSGDLRNHHSRVVMIAVRVLLGIHVLEVPFGGVCSWIHYGINLVQI